MRNPLRVTLALALHIGFFVVPAAVVVAIFGVAGMAFRAGASRDAIQAALAAIVVAAIAYLGMRAVLRVRERFRGVIIDRESQPQLWRLVTDLSDAAGIAAPDQLRVTSEPTVRVREKTGLLGLRRRRCALEIGVPLLTGLNVTEMRAVLACEIGLQASRGALGRTVQRCTVAVEQAASDLTGGPMTWLFGGYARLFLSLAGPDSADLDADALAVRLVGKRAAITALRKTTAVEFGWHVFSEEYLAMAMSVKHTPELIPGFRAFLDHPARKKQLAEHAKQSITEETDFADGNDGPTRRIRVETMKRMQSRDRQRDRQVDDRPAFALIRNARRALPALEDKLMIDGLGCRMPWPELVQKAGAAEAAKQAKTLSLAVAQSGVSQDSTIAAVLAAIHRGQGTDLVNPVLNPGLSAEHVPDAAVDTLAELLGGTIVDALIRAGRAKHEFDWGGPPLVRLSSGQPLDPIRLVRPAVADPRLIPGLHRALVNIGVPLHHCQPPADDPEPSLAGIVSAVGFDNDLYELLVSDRGLLLVPNHSSTAARVLAVLSSRLRRSEYEKLSELSKAGVSQLREESGAQWIDSRDVASATWRQRSRGWTLELELYLDEYSVSELNTSGIGAGSGILADDEGRARLKLRSTADSEEHDDPYGGLGELMGARMHMEQPRD